MSANPTFSIEISGGDTLRVLCEVLFPDGTTKTAWATEDLFHLLTSAATRCGREESLILAGILQKASAIATKRSESEDALALDVLVDSVLDQLNLNDRY